MAFKQADIIKEAHERIRDLLDREKRSNRTVDVNFLPFTTLTLKDYTSRFEIKDKDGTVVTTSLRDLEQGLKDCAKKHKAEFTKLIRGIQGCRFCGLVCASAAGLANHERACTRELRPVDSGRGNGERGAEGEAEGGGDDEAEDGEEDDAEDGEEDDAEDGDGEGAGPAANGDGAGSAADGSGTDADVLLVDDDDVLAVAKHRLSGLQSEDARKRAEFYLKIRSSLDSEVDPLDPDADKKYVENIAKARDRSNVRHSASSHAALEKAVSDVTKARAALSTAESVLRQELANMDKPRKRQAGRAE